MSHLPDLKALSQISGPSGPTAQSKIDEWSTRQDAPTDDQLLTLLCADVLRELALHENKAGEVARTILRAQRDGQSASVQHLVVPLAVIIARAIPRIYRKDAKTGRFVLDIEP